MKKSLLTMGTFAAAIAPVATVIACSSESSTSLKTDLDKFMDADSTKDKANLNTAIGSKAQGDVVTAADLGITTPTLTDGVTAEYKIEKVYDNATGLVEIKVNLKKGSDKVKDNSKVIEIQAKDATKIDLATDLAKFMDADSTKVNTVMDTALNAKSVGDAVSADELGFTEPTLVEATSASYEVVTAYNESAGTIEVKVTLTKGSESVENNEKNITITAKKVDLATESAKIIDAGSSKDKATLTTDIGSKSVGESVSAAELGYTLPSLKTGVTATFVIKTVYDGTAGTVGITATLAEGIELVENNTKDFVISASDA